jgi:thiosulfate/3-mercaptopyruvate sulfurtransferase
MYRTLISVDDLAANLDDPAWVVVDARFDLTAPAAGEEAYLAEHIAGAVFADLERDLSAPVIPGVSGRHPLPTPEAIAATFGRLGVQDGTQVVAYDAQGAAFAARVWWLLRYIGHEEVAVLDGGWQAWLAAGGAVRSGVEHKPARDLVPRARLELVADADDVDAARHHSGRRVVDSRSADRYRGENETIDAVAGHIPGAVNLPFAANVGPDGRFRPVPELRERFRRLLADTPPEAAIFYCGSGVTAAQNLLALSHAGGGDARLYAGSWSEWITDPDRPIATGE